MAAPFKTREEDIVDPLGVEDARLTTEEDEDGGTGAPDEQEDDDGDLDIDEVDLLHILLEYYESAKESRESGLSARDDEWEKNYDAYWTRNPNTSSKESWQADESLPEVQESVDRFAAALRETLIQGEDWYDFDMPGDVNNDLKDHVRRFMKILMNRSGRDRTTGHVLGFDHTFYEIAKSGAITAMCAQCTIDDNNRPICEALDARQVYLDPSGRNRFRIRRYEADWDELLTLAEEDDSPYDLEAIEELQTASSGDDEGRIDRETSSSSGEDDSTSRKTIEILEFRCDILNRDGELVASNQQVIIADQRTIIMAPRDNPFWHGFDWIVYAPPITVPFAVYGRSQVEGYRQLVDTFTSMTNMILDAAFVGSMNAYMIWIDALEDPTQASSIHPNKMFIASDEVPFGTEFVKKIELGGVSPSTLQVWQGIQGMLRKATQQNELSLGQLPPKGDITAAEVNSVDTGQSQLGRSLARDVEDRILSPILFMMWSNGLQFLEDDPRMREELGEDTFNMLLAQKRGFQSKAIHFKARGITDAIERNARLRGMLAATQTITQNPFFLEIFKKTYSGEKWMDQMLSDLRIPITQMKLTETEKQMKQQEAITAERAALAAGQGDSGGAPGGPGGPEGIAVEN